MENLLVRFTQKVPPYQAGETAGFPPPEARRFIDLKVAEPMEREAPARGEVITKPMQPQQPQPRQPKGRR